MRKFRKKITLRRRRIPTDLEILDEIHDRYFDRYAAFQHRGDPNNLRATWNYVPIDVEAIAESLDEDGNLIFGRLYYHLQQKYGYEYTRDGKQGKVPFFEPFLPTGERHCINFPLMTSVLAGLRRERSQARTAFWLAIVAIIISSISVGHDFFVALYYPQP